MTSTRQDDADKETADGTMPNSVADAQGISISRSPALLAVTAISANNSIEFVRHVFECFRAHEPIAIVRPGLDLHEYPGLVAERSVAPEAGGGWGKESFVTCSSSDPAQILFSSGTTGRPKAIVLSYLNISDVVERLNGVMELDTSVREYVGVPVTYSFGLGRVRAVSAAGGRFFLPERFDPLQIRSMLDKEEINAISAVPTLWRLILKSPDVIGSAGRLVRWIEIGSQHMSADEKRMMMQLFPNARIVQHYGLTEASRTTFLTLSEKPSIDLESVGTAVSPAKVRIGPNDEIYIRGDHVALGVLDEIGEIIDLKDREGWLHSGDRGSLSDGCLTFLGRLDDQMNIGGIKLSADHLERAISDLCGSPDGFAIASVPDPLRGDTVLLALTEEVRDRKKSIVAAAESVLARSGIDPRGNLHVFSVESIPRTGNGKIKRSELRGLWSAREPTVEGRDDGGRKGRFSLRTLANEVLRRRRGTVSDVFQAHFPRDRVSSDASFNSLGGDSLSYVAVSLELESLLGHLPENWANMSISELNAHSPVTRWFVPLDTPTLVRALSIMLIVAGHFDALNYGGGGAYALFVVAGLSFSMFTLPQVLRVGNVAAIQVLAIRIALLTLCYTLLNLAVTGYGEWPAFLFIGSWISPTVEGSAWFIEVYLQLLCILMVVLSFPDVRRTIQSNPFRAFVTAAAISVGVAAMSDALVDTHHLYRRLPHLLAWVFLTGVAAGLASSTLERGIVSAVLLLGVWQFGNYEMIKPGYFVFAALALIWVPHIPMPRTVSMALRFIAGASLMIYLSHFQFAALSRALFGDHPQLSWLVAIVGGVLVWRLYEPVDAWLNRRIQGILGRNQHMRPEGSRPPE
ncbi:AMP-binding protein [Palleronia sp. KMU-117]|uniref:AMP-binding protein n=1 Tax=Palleronia sp. KMU-117 TaxID=3434108 RepID=UPI003D71F83D